MPLYRCCPFRHCQGLSDIGCTDCEYVTGEKTTVYVQYWYQMGDDYCVRASHRSKLSYCWYTLACWGLKDLCCGTHTAAVDVSRDASRLTNPNLNIFFLSKWKPELRLLCHFSNTGNQIIMLLPKINPKSSSNRETKESDCAIWSVSRLQNTHQSVSRPATAWSQCAVCRNSNSCHLCIGEVKLLNCSCQLSGVCKTVNYCTTTHAITTCTTTMFHSM